MQPLNLPECPLTIKKQNNRLFVFDTQRKRYVALTPEEWVRQHFIHLLIVEVKAPTVPITQAVFDQVAVYNLRLGVQFFMVSNGLEHYCCRVDRAHNHYDFLPALPTYGELCQALSCPVQA